MLPKWSVRILYTKWSIIWRLHFLQHNEISRYRTRIELVCFCAGNESSLGNRIDGQKYVHTTLMARCIGSTTTRFLQRVNKCIQVEHNWIHLNIKGAWFIPSGDSSNTQITNNEHRIKNKVHYIGVSNLNCWQQLNGVLAPIPAHSLLLSRYLSIFWSKLRRKKQIYSIEKSSYFKLDWTICMCVERNKASPANSVSDAEWGAHWNVMLFVLASALERNWIGIAMQTEHSEYRTILNKKPKKSAALVCSAMDAVASNSWHSQ